MVLFTIASIPDPRPGPQGMIDTKHFSTDGKKLWPEEALNVVQQGKDAAKE